MVMTTLREGRRPLVRPVPFADHLREYSWPSFLHLVEKPGFETVETFEFYRRFATLAWEGQYTIQGNRWLRRVPGLSSLLWWFFGVLAHLDVLSGMPGNGLGLAAKKLAEKQQS